MCVSCDGLVPWMSINAAGGAGLYLAVHAAQSSLLHDEVAGRLQEVGAEVSLLDVVVLVTAVSGPGSGPEPDRHTQIT